MTVKSKADALIAILEDARQLAEGLVSAAEAEGLPIAIADIASEIKVRMKTYGLSVELLAEQSGTSKNSIYKAMNDPRSMAVSTLESILEPLGLSLCFAKL